MDGHVHQSTLRARLLTAGARLGERLLGEVSEPGSPERRARHAG
jgi:hypothetical protein